MDMPVLRNFTLSHEKDQQFYEMCRRWHQNLRQSQEEARQLIEDTERELAAVQERYGDASESDRNVKRFKAYLKLEKICDERWIELLELRLLLKTLDFKISMVLKYLREPEPGFFARMGIGIDHPLLTPGPDVAPQSMKPRRPHLVLVKR